LEMGARARGSERCAESACTGGVEQLDRAGNRANRVAVNQFLENLGLTLPQRPALTGFGAAPEQVGDQMVAALPDLELDAVGWDPVPKTLERLGPRCYVGRVAIQKCAIDVKNQRVQHCPKIGQCWT